jgi:hypothetical protein
LQLKKKEEPWRTELFDFFACWASVCIMKLLALLALALIALQCCTAFVVQPIAARAGTRVQPLQASAAPVAPVTSAVEARRLMTKAATEKDVPAEIVYDAIR